MGERRGMKALELWCRRITKGYPGVRITNMTTSWRNGLGFCAIIHHFRPDLIDFDSLSGDDVYKNNALAFETAETCLGVPALLDPQDMVDHEVPDRLSIMTYVSQFYQAFVGQQGVPRQSSADSETPATPEPAPPAAEKSVATSVRQREPCSVCGRPVFLAERMLVERRLVHRTCFSCARCRSPLSTANYYVTEDGLFCCEVCPDEEVGGRVQKTAAVLAEERAVLAGPDHDPLADSADAVLELELRRSSAAAAGVPSSSSSSGSESDSDESEEGSAAPRTEVATDRREGGGGEGGPGATDVSDKETVGAGESSGPSEAAETVASQGDDIARTEDRSDGEMNGVDAERAPVEVTPAQDQLETDSNPFGADSDPGESKPESEPGPPETDSPPVALRRSRSGESRSSRDEGAGERLSLVQQRLRLFAAAERPQPAPRKARRTSPETSAPPEEPPETRETEACGEERESAGTPEQREGGEATAQTGEEKQDAPDKETEAKETPNPFDDEEEERTEIVSTETAEEEHGAEVPADLSTPKPPDVPSVEVTEPTPEKPTAPKEYNPFDEDDEEEGSPAPASEAAPAAVAKPTAGTSAAEEEYPDDLNPFGEDEEEEEKEEPVPPPKPARMPAAASLNPFGDSEDEDEEEEGSSGLMTPVSSVQSSPAKPVSPREINPFEKPPRPPPPTLDRRMLAARAAAAAAGPLPSAEPSGLLRERRSGSLTSLTSTSGKKKRPAPRPPGHVSPAAAAAVCGGSQGISPAESPSTLRKRHAPPPPPTSQSASPAGTEAPPSPSSSKAAKEQDNKAAKDQVNIAKQSSNSLTNKSEEGKYKRRKGPAPLRPKPIKRQVKTVPPKEMQTELHDINVKQLEMERQGVELEKTIRQLTELEAKEQKEVDSTAPYGLDIEDMILQLFDLVNEKNALFRRQAELMYMRRQHRLEEEHAELEYEIRCLMMKADSLKTEAERQREQQLIDRLVSVVEQRNEIVTMLEMERIREIQEDASIDYHMGLYTAERVGSAEPTPEKKKKKKKEKKKKEKEGSSKKKKKGHDADKDIDEKEHVTEKKKSKKIKLKKLFS